MVAGAGPQGSPGTPWFRFAPTPATLNDFPFWNRLVIPALLEQAKARTLRLWLRKLCSGMLSVCSLRAVRPIHFALFLLSLIGHCR